MFKMIKTNVSMDQEIQNFHKITVVSIGTTLKYIIDTITSIIEYGAWGENNVILIN